MSLYRSRAGTNAAHHCDHVAPRNNVIRFTVGLFVFTLLFALGTVARIETGVSLELELLDRTIEKLYPLPEDLAVARIADTQGLGGSSSAG